MPPQPIIDPSELDLENTVFDSEGIRKRNSQRHEMEMIDRIIFFDSDRGLIAGVREVRDDEFWVRGHFPGRPIFPGVMMLEAAAQLCSFYRGEVMNDDEIVGFAAANDVRFRGTVVPGDTFVVTGRAIQIKERVARFELQGLVRSAVVFETQIVGMVI